MTEMMIDARITEISDVTAARPSRKVTLLTRDYQSNDRPLVGEFIFWDNPRIALEIRAISHSMRDPKMVIHIANNRGQRLIPPAFADDRSDVEVLVSLGFEIVESPNASAE